MTQSEPVGPRVLLDTSVLIAQELARPVGRPPSHGAISVVTIAELNAGVLAARDDEARARRLATLSLAESRFEPLGIDAEVARAWALLVHRGRLARRRTPVNDCWIAATALVHGLVVATQDGDYEGLGIEVMRL